VVAIAESQLDTWSQQGKTAQFTTTYNSIREKLLDGHAPYPVKNVEIRLQGSYGNDTNVWADSDVDIVLKHTGAFYHDLSEMPAEKQQAFTKAYGADAAYGYHHFKTDALKWINGLYKDDVDSSGKKAIKVRGNGNRRNADIIICQEFRRYRNFNGIGREEFAEGMAFYVGNQRIENFPKQHSDNCTAKHQETGNFKHMVRIFKNMRNRMIENGLLAEGIAPSYFIEGMLWNVPKDKFAGTYTQAWVACFNWLVTTDKTKLTTASGLHWLVRDNSLVCWPTANFNTFTAALKRYWES
jgi:hypothetical protein